MSQPIRFSDLFDRARDKAELAKPFLVMDGKPCTYGQFIDRVARLIGVLNARGLSAGARAGIVSEDPVMVGAILMACLRAGVAVVNFDPGMTPVERSNALTATDLSHLFIDRAAFDAGPLPVGLVYSLIEPASGGGGLLGRLLKRSNTTSSATGLAAEIENTPPAPWPAPIEPDRIGLMLFTSGTTSAPKVVQLSHANLGAQLTTFSKVYDYDPASRILNPLPMHFTDGIVQGPLVTFLSGATLYRPRRFNVQDLGGMLDGIYRDRITHFNVVPAILSLLDQLGDEYNSAFATPDFRYIRSSGDRLPEKLWQTVQDRFGVRVINTYGLSETVCEALYCGPSDETYRIGTVGKPIDCEIRLINDDGSPAPAGETGELCVRGTNIMGGYLNRPDLTSQVLDAAGWFRTGDLATIDGEGFVTITGRKKALIIAGGVNIQPQEIVDAMLRHPQVAEAHAFGLPDPVWGERAVCAVVPRGSAARPGEHELIEHARGLLSPHKVPRAVKLIDALPRNPAGKVLVDQLRRHFTAAERVAANGAAGPIEDQVIEIAARVFVCRPSDLRLSSEPRATFGWDSFAHLTLINEVEGRFGVEFSARDVLRVHRLGDLVDIVRQARTADA